MRKVSKRMLAIIDALRHLEFPLDKKLFSDENIGLIQKYVLKNYQVDLSYYDAKNSIVDFTNDVENESLKLSLKKAQERLADSTPVGSSPAPSAEVSSVPRIPPIRPSWAKIVKEIAEEMDINLATLKQMKKEELRSVMEQVKQKVFEKHGFSPSASILKRGLHIWNC